MTRKDDPAAWAEAIGEELAQETEYAVRVMGPQVQNRPMYETPKPPEVQHQEWAEAREALLTGNPQPLMERLQFFQEILGPTEGEIEFRKWYTKHSKMVAEMEQEDAGSTY